MKKAFLLVSVILVLFFCCDVFAQESFTLSTYYPSPYGIYQDLIIYRNFTFREIAAGDPEVQLSTDLAGNLHISATRHGAPQLDSHLIFDDVGRPYTYLQAFDATSGPVYCADGYIAASWFDENLLPVDPDDLPEIGNYVCVRGWEIYN